MIYRFPVRQRRRSLGNPPLRRPRKQLQPVRRRRLRSQRNELWKAAMKKSGTPMTTASSALKTVMKRTWKREQIHSLRLISSRQNQPVEVRSGLRPALPEEQLRNVSEAGRAPMLLSRRKVESPKPQKAQRMVGAKDQRKRRRVMVTAVVFRVIRPFLLVD